jgi:hypothetical protein
VGERHLGVLHEQVDMVLFCVEAGPCCVEVCAHVGHDLFAPVEHLRVEHATAVLGDEHPVDVQVMGGAATTPSIGVWVPGR